MVNFHLEADGPYSKAFREKGITEFSQACSFVQQLPYGRNLSRNDFTLVLQEEKGTCSSKHALLVALAEENARQDIELIAGIFLMSGETHDQLKHYFSDKTYDQIPECHCYIRHNGKRYDFTGFNSLMDKIAPKLVREQRIEPQQVIDWKIVIHKDYLERWLKRNPSINLSLAEIWKDREEIISLL